MNEENELSNMDFYANEKKGFTVDRTKSHSIKEIKLPSEEKRWLKYFPENICDAKILEMTVFERIRKTALENPNDTALEYLGTTISFNELLNNIEIIAKALKRFGIKQDDAVMLCMPNQPELVYLFYALNKIGAIPNLIEPRTPAVRINQYVNDCEAKFMFTIDDCVSNIDKMVENSTLQKVVAVSVVNSLKSGVKKSLYLLSHKPTKTNSCYVNWVDFMKDASKLPDVDTVTYKPGAIASVVYTGGTTSIPKGAKLPNEAYNGQNMQLEYTELYPTKNSKFLGVVPIFSAYGSSSGMHNALSSGTMVDLIPKFNANDFVKLLYTHRPTHVMGVPKWFRQLADFLNIIDSLPKCFEPIKKKFRLDFVQHLISGGDKYLIENEKNDNEIIQKFGGPKIKKGLGMSEFGGGFLTTVSEDANKLGSVGVPHVGNIVKIVDVNTKEELSYNEEGEILVTGPTMMGGYLNREEENNKFFVTDENNVVWAKTGDLGFVDEDGCFFFSDRLKYVIMRPDGHTVPLLPIENVICKCSDVESCVAVGVPEIIGQMGERPMAFVIMKKNCVKSEDEVKKELEQLCQEYLPEREMPKWFQFVDDFPYTLLEKVDREKLKKIGISIIENGTFVLNDADKDTKKLDKIKRKVLQLKHRS